MASVEDIKKELAKAEQALEVFENEECGGQWLKDLKQREKSGGTLSDREAKRLDKLEEEKKSREDQVRDLQKSLAATAAQPGNDFVTRRWGHRVVCTWGRVDVGI